MAKFALCVGINKYTSRAINSLKVCENDAITIANILEENPFNYEKVNILSTRSGYDFPTKNNILHFLREMCEGALEDDVILIYYSGHGFRQNDNQYLVPPDAHPTNVDGFINIVELKNIIKESKARQKLFIIDACKTGEDLSGLKKIQSYIDPEQIKDIFSDVKGVYMIFSSSRDEFSWEDSSGDHSVFTKFLVRALMGEEESALRGSILTVESLFEYLALIIPRYSRTACPSKMTPVSYCITTAPMILADFKSIDKNNAKRIYDVFVPVGTPTLTYVTREKEKDFQNALNRPGKQIYLHGMSGCGKTSLYETVMKENQQKYIMVPCKASFENSLVLNVNIYFKVARKLPEFNPAAHYDLQIAQLTHDAMDRLAEDLGKEKVVLVLDDFHRLPLPVMREFADTVKTFVLLNAKILFVGVSNTADQLISMYPDLNQRIDGIELKTLSRGNLLKIIERGSEILNVKFDPSLSTAIIKQSLGSASLVHDLCLSILEEMGIQKKCKTQISIEDLNLLTKACQKVAIKQSRIYRTIFSALSYGRRKAKKYATYRMIMEAIASMDDDRMVIRADKLYETLSMRFGDYIPPRYNFSQALSHFRKIQINLKEVISFNELTDTIEIVDPGFKFYLNWSVRPSIT